MACVTRFNPSCTGGLHLGHVYIMLVNEHFAHERKGEFIIRFDDRYMDHPTRPLPAEAIARIREQMKEDIYWLGIDVDRWISEAEEENRLHQFCVERHILPPQDDRGGIALDFYQEDGTYHMPYVPLQTFERAMFDQMYGTTHVIRGQELATETALWQHFCHLSLLPEPVFIYMPRLRCNQGPISKTLGNLSIAQLRADGYTRDQIMDALKLGCLHYVGNGWAWENLKPQPRVAL